MVCRVGHTCLIQFQLFDEDQDETLTLDRCPLCESTCGKDLYDYIEKHTQIQANRFKLYLSSAEKVIDLSKMKDKTMVELGLDFSFDRDSTEPKYTLLVVGPDDKSCQKAFRGGPSKCHPAPASHLSSIWEEDNNVDFKSYIKSKTCYVGLVNQAMTCYLNSLLQALYMTPEFRNALYNWEYVNGSGTDEANSIPYQLQKLFLNLQTSSRSAVETTPLTKSFGWDSTEAWQQHDIQELCRVMFDALEQKFKNTEQADLINRHYEGMMIDYVKCLECGTEKSREDTFLDIPLPVRSFGSNVAYNSVEEALKAFVQYETLEGSNQYYCEKCNKKCNAHKGLKFTKFPYLVTLHLKRFDFDFKTYHRVKLNDKVTFPDILNLNPFISSTRNHESPGSDENISLVKCDDGSTTDSGTLDDDYPSCESSLPNSNHSRNHDQDGDDEGIHISNCPSTSNCTVHNHENEKNHSNNEAKGPYNYELFSIMIHSGSASGGHYYAYIKDFKTQEWLCFNDQSVTQITHDDIQKTYGGGPTRPYYSGACSSTNAYMLMYRQIDPVRNALPMQVQDFPKHIQELLKKMKENEDNDKICRVPKVCHFNYESVVPNSTEQKLLNMGKDIVHKCEMRTPLDFHAQLPVSKIIVYCMHPLEGKKRIGIPITFGATLEQITQLCYEYFELTKIVSFNQCRLVLYDHNNDTIISSYEGREHETLDIYKMGGSSYLLEIRKVDEEFQPYNDISTTVYIIDIPRKKFIDGPIDVPGTRSQTVKEYKQVVAKTFGRDLGDMKVFLQKYGLDAVIEVDDDVELQTAGFTHLMNVYISNVPDTECKTFHHSTICELIENYKNTILLFLKLPELSKESLEEWNIPLLDEKYKDKEKPIDNSPSKVSVNDSHRDVSPKRSEVPKSEKSCNEDAPVRNASPQLGESEEWNTPEQSNSEDSSLSDSDKTLVGDALEHDYFLIEKVSSNKSNRLKQIKLEHRDNVVDDEEYYFEATPYTVHNQKFLKVQVDKRMTFIALKNALEPYVGVPTEYFKICHQLHELYGSEWCNIKDKLAVCAVDQEFCIKLTRPLRSDEFTVTAYQLDINSPELYKLLGEIILSTDMTFGQAKKEILALIKRKHNIDIPFDRCRLREKCGSLVTTLYLDHQKLEDHRIGLPSEIVVQELPDKEPVTSSDQHVVFVRKWSPTSMQLGPLEEIIMDRNSVMELKTKLSAISDIPEKYISITKMPNYFLNMLPIIRNQNYQGWSGHVDYKFDLDLDDGSMVLYRDNREVVNNLSREALNDITIQDPSVIFPRSSRRSRKEKALIIKHNC